MAFIQIRSRVALIDLATIDLAMIDLAKIDRMDPDDQGRRLPLDGPPIASFGGEPAYKAKERPTRPPRY
jgi:hypothetical protein